MYDKLFNKSWTEFIEDLIIQNQYKASDSDLRSFTVDGSYDVVHWAPYWWTCQICSARSQPDLVIKTETLQSDFPVLRAAIGLEENVTFPFVRIMGTKGKDEVETKDSREFLREYYSQLTRRQLLELYEFYKIDFLLFDYNIDEYLEMVH